jgi:uncharacterized protein
MRLYAASSTQFVEDTIQNQIAEKLKLAFFDHYRHEPAPSEVASWRNSLRSVKDLVQRANLLDHGILLEFQLPLSSRRLDCLFCGRDARKLDRSVIVELKQWEKCTEADGENEVLTFLGGGRREVLHPSVQVGQYEMYLRDTHTAFYDGATPISLNSCSYLHNYLFQPNDPLLAPKFQAPLARSPLFSADDVNSLSDYLRDRLAGGEGLEVLRRVEESKYRPSKKLMDHVASVIHGTPQYVLLDEQLVAFDRVLATVRQGFHHRQKTAIIIRGGPGTGKSLIAINLMAALLTQGYNTHYATGSRAFTETLRKIVGMRGAIQFKYFNSYAEAQPNEIDVLVCDEAHRIRETSANRFSKQTARTGTPQIDELFQSAKVVVFLIDDYQVVRPNEIGSADYLRAHAEQSHCQLHEYTLDVQFRCGGSEAFVNWVNNTLDIRKTPNILLSREHQQEFEFHIFKSPADLDAAIREKAHQGHVARMTAGFCWPWADPTPQGDLVNDVVIGTYQRPWNAKPDGKRPVRNAPKSHFWATDPRGIDQVGCIYTAQGFDLDYVGVIFGTDLVYDPDQGIWVGRPENSYDTVVKRSGEKFTDLAKNTYRVLLSRGLKGCYVCFQDKNTERFVRSRIE